MIKSEHIVRVTATTGTPAAIGLMCGQGVEWARLGQNDPFLPLPPTYDMPLPYANIVFDDGPSDTGVMAFPFTSKAITPQPMLSTAFPRVRKPRFTIGS